MKMQPTQQLRTLAALPEDPGSVLSTHIVWLEVLPQPLTSLSKKCLESLVGGFTSAPGRNFGMLGGKLHFKLPPLGVTSVQTPPLRKPTKS